MSRPSLANVTAIAALVLAAYVVCQGSQLGIAYFAAFVLGMATAFAPIVGRPRDEASGARMLEAVASRFVSGGLSVAALWLLLSTRHIGSTWEPEASLLAMVGNVCVAALGAALLIRLPLFAAQHSES
jgi:hypothetical protein